MYLQPPTGSFFKPLLTVMCRCVNITRCFCLDIFFHIFFLLFCPSSSSSSSADLRSKSWQKVTRGPQGLPGKKVMGPTPERTFTLSTHRAADSFDPVAPAQVSWRLVRKFIGTTGRGLCLFSSFNEERDRLSEGWISPKKHKERKLLLLPDVSLSGSLPKNLCVCVRGGSLCMREN